MQKEKKIIIPNFDHLFDEEIKGNKKKSNFIRKLLLTNIWGIILSCFVYLFQFAPVLVTPLLTSDIVNVVTDTLTVGGTITAEIWKQIIIETVVIVVVIATNIPFTRIRYRVVSKILRRTDAGIKCTVIRKLQSLSITYTKDMETGKIQSKFIKDTENFKMFFEQLLQSILPNVISVVVSVILAIVKSGIVSLFFLITIPLNLSLTFLFKNKIKKQSKDFRINSETMSSKVNTMLEMIPVTKAHGLEDTEFNTVSKEIDKVRNSGETLDKTIAHFGSLHWVINTIMGALCVVFCAVLAINKVIKVGDIVLYQSLFATINGYVAAVINSFPSLAIGIDSASSLSELMNVYEIEMNLKEGSKSNIKGNIEFKNVSYCYPNTKSYVIKNLNLSVKKGECIAIVGSSGSGKSTLMNLIIGLLKPTEGEILVDKVSLKEIDLTEYRHNISVVPQTPVLFAGSIRDNITYGLTQYDDKDVKEVVELANINEFLKDLPNGLDTNVGERGEKLSGGQKQRVTIARALIRKPKILIFDEATSALDNVSEFHVQKAIAASTKNKTTFIVAHRLSTIRNADRILVLENGEIVESGNYDQLMKLNGRFAELKKLNDINSKAVE